MCEMKPKLEDVLFLGVENIEPYIDLGVVTLKKSQSHYKRIAGKNDSNRKRFESLNDKISDESMEQMIIDALKGKFFPGFIKYFKTNYNELMDKARKNAQKSAEARIKANKLFAKKIHDARVHMNICKMYSDSIAFAPGGSKELVLAYECRSNFLLHLKKYEDCIKDVDRALAITKFNLLKVKLLCRKMTCFLAIDKDIYEKKELWLSIKSNFEEIDGALKDEKFLKMVKQAKNDSLLHPTNEAEIANRSSKPLITFPNVALKYNKEIGVLANRDFVPGEEVVVTKPLTANVNLDKFWAYCSHCLSFMWTGIPCDACSLCMYCSEECKAEAWEKYHILECKVLPHINFDNNVYYFLQTSIKIFMMGLREFGSIAKLKEEIDKLKDYPNLVKNGEFQLFDSDFLNFYITPNLYVSDMDFMLSFAKNGCFLLAYIIQTCDIFEQDVKYAKGKELSKNKDIVFTALLLMKIYMSCIDNCFFSDQLYTKKAKCTKHENLDGCDLKRSCYTRGVVFHPFYGMFEKSCNPNVARCWTDDGKIIYYCVQPIKKMEKISVCWSLQFYYIDRELRLTYAPDSMVLCKCVPCEKNWPTMTKLFKKFQQRRSKLENKEAKIVQKYLERNDFTVGKVVEKNWILDESEFQELAKDVNDVVKVCGQPSFASSLMTAILCTVYEKLHGAISLESHIPVDC